MFKDLFLNEAKFKGSIVDIKVEEIEPEKKDIERVEKLKSSGEDKMARAITDPIKLVRRTKAYVAKNGSKDNPFIDAMVRMGFNDKQLKQLGNFKAKPELPDPVKRNGKDYKSEKSGGAKRRFREYDADYYIMNASSVYSGKLSKVIPDTWGDTVILLGTRNGKSKIAIVGSASGMKDNENGLDYYSVPKSGFLNYTIDTGNGYRHPTSEIVVTDYVLVKDGKAVTKFKDQSYSYYVFK